LTSYGHPCAGWRRGAGVGAGALAVLAAVVSLVPSRAAAAPIVAAAGDIACAPSDGSFNGGNGTAERCRQRHTSDLLVDRGYDAVLPLGDIQYQLGRLEAFRASYEPSWGRVKSITRPVPGNHDYGTPGARGYFDYFNGVSANDGSAGRRGRGYYSFDLGRWHVVALNSNCRQVRCGRGSAQLRWLRADLRRSGRRCVLAYSHHPRFSSGEHGDSPRLRLIFRALTRSGVDLLLSGHDHHYERFAPRRGGGAVDRERGTRQFVVGTGGRSLIPLPGRPDRASGTAIDSAFGVLRLRLRPRGYGWRFASEAGVLDRGAGRCGERRG
jgi:acid phosphatase type 7